MTSLPKYPRAVTASAAILRAIAMAVLAIGSLSAGAQSSRLVTSSTADATRAELTARLDSLVRVDSTDDAKDERRGRTEEISAIRSRLTTGDFRSGDRFLVEFGADRKRDTVFVREGESITLANWTPASLHGVLRSELQSAVERYVGIYVREPRVRVFPLTRLAINGAVQRPGFYAVDPEVSLSDAIMSAGGPGSSAQYDKITVYRGGTRLMDSKQVTRALKEGRTVDQLGLQSGDQVRVAEKKQRNWAPIIQATLIGVTAFSALLALVRASYAN